MRKVIFCALMLGASALASVQAQAQTAPQAADDAADKPAVTSEDIVVTGSRVITNGNNSPTPMTVVSTEQLLKVAPSTVVDAINLAPALQGSQTTASNPGGGQRNGAAAYLNLRNLGDLRTLVLFDGHRVVPTINAQNANVDSWVVPQLLIKRVDVVTGGVSAVYGSDAVSGVVNFVTDTQFTGVKFQASSGVSTYGDDHIVDVGAAFGTRFGNDRGHFEASLQYRQDPGLLTQLDRPFFAQSLGGAGAGTAASPYFNVANQRFSNSTFGGLITNGLLANLQFAQDGQLSAFNSGTASGTSNVAYGGDGSWYRLASIKSALEFIQAFGRFDYELTDSIHFYAQGAGTWNKTKNSFRSPLETVNIGWNNPYLDSVQQPYQATIQAQRISSPTGSFQFRRLIDIPGTAAQKTDTWMAMTGLDGGFGKDWKWNVQFSQSRSKLRAQNLANVDQGKFFAAANAVRNPSNPSQIVCNAALTNANYANCVPVNLFGPTSITPQALAYFMTTTTNINTTDLTEIEGSLTGSPFDTWAGPVKVALSGEYRRIGWSVAADAVPSDRADCNGIQFNNCTVNTVKWLQTTTPSLAGVSQKVTEGALEVDVPLAKDMAFAKELNVNGAIRQTHYSTTGDVTTWKVGATWRPVADLLLRGTHSRDIRAPNVFELYSPTSVAPSNFTDGLTGASLQNFGVGTVSNPNLTPERSNSWTAGIVYTPSYVPGLSVSVDFYSIKISNAIVLIQGNTAAIQTACAASLGAGACQDVIVRPNAWTDKTTANNPTAVYQKFLNIASFSTRGVDVEANYKTEIADHGLNLRALLSWQPKLTYDQGQFGVVDFGNVATAGTLTPASPGFKYTAIASFDITDQINLTWMQRGRGAMKAFAVPAGTTEKEFVGGNRVAPVTYSNVTLTFDVKHGGGDFQFYANVQNLFNQQPKVTYAGGNANPGLGLFGFFPANGDDVVGRYFTAGVRAKF
ncbi:TonB-dependent receptor [Novosphingobium flavum]|uniref:TonB-dependent receptor n=1 Tax=Novosphingobium flavum TaxID=1778672 RepID=A0A7X1KLR8_9SPHN|nr:TonB-dependent receptor [Novosphingobium flavum]MBC2665862.1 TonB-dependent receptor [Novosphingobium flavum]